MFRAAERTIKKFLPKSFLLKIYYPAISLLANFFYGQPSEKMIVIGVTGTAGKSTTVNLIGRILEAAGHRVGWTSTLNFKINDREWTNRTKMTMLGKFSLQKLLKEMINEKCEYAIIETSSEGVAQSRHLGINYDILVFTNLSPEHIESHGGFNNYRLAKGELFAHLEKNKRKILNGRNIEKTKIINLDDENSAYFLGFRSDKTIGYTIKDPVNCSNFQIDKTIRYDQFLLKPNITELVFNGVYINFLLLGEFNAYNALAAISAIDSFGIEPTNIKNGLESIKIIPGRLEYVNAGQNFSVIIDYAHTPEELKKVYNFLNTIKNNKAKIISVFGSAGGGRDKWKRSELGKLAATLTDIVIITNEDPYDEDSKKIINEISAGAKNIFEPRAKIILEISDRRSAIQKAISFAEAGDVVIVTGKGSEECIMGPRNTKIPWNDKAIALELLK